MKLSFDLIGWNIIDITKNSINETLKYFKNVCDKEK